MSYRVRLSEFEGPLDLLLFFIKRDELDIQNIPISRITQEFLEYLHLMVSLDLEVAGDFIVMAAELMQIKVRMLLPRDESAPEEDDPRAELVRRLIEYKRYKEMSIHMGSIEAEQRKVHYRRFFHADTHLEPSEEPGEGLKEISLFNLISAFKIAMDHMPKKVVHEVTIMNVTVDEQMSFVLDFLRVHGPTTLLRIVAHMTEKIRMIVTVIALLELTKNRMITILPAATADDVAIRLVTPVVAIQAGATA
jgi:segregation and condensation protein A